MTDPWERRLRRAAHLEKEWPSASFLMPFLLDITRFQRLLSLEILSTKPASFDPESILDWIPMIQGRLEESPTKRFRRLLFEWEELPRSERLLHLSAGWTDSSDPEEDSPWPLLARSFLEPLAAWHFRARPAEAQEQHGSCPACRHAPLVSILREDRQAETVRRSLLCSLCSREWGFPRVVCPRCGEEQPEKLPRYTAQEIPWIRVEACDTCMTYLKAVDLTKNPDAEPVVDELGSTPLDIIAHERGYSKLAPNFAGL